jgi:hypothetical protein
MSLPASGIISLSNIVYFFNSNPVPPFRFSHYYQDATEGFCTGVVGIPKKGELLDINYYKGKSKPIVAGSNQGYSIPNVSLTFTNATASNNTGPTLSQIRNSYSNSGSWVQNSNNLNMTTQGIQIWTVPTTNKYKITVAGASGGSANSNGGRGLVAYSIFNLSQGDKLNILVGQQGGVGSGGSTGGGGGSFVTTSTNVPLIVCGGGGGFLATPTSNLTAFADASSNTWGNNSRDGSGLGGSNMNGGAGSSNGWGGGGGGFSNNGTAGANASSSGFSGLGYSFLNGGVGGDTATTAYGGFGGGGGTHGSTGGGGGGGGIWWWRWKSKCITKLWRWWGKLFIKYPQHSWL